jgi:ChrR-like protein with cupin domain
VTKRLSPVLAQPYSVRLVRMQGEAYYPPRRHTGPQELYILVGALTIADQVLHAGDYCAAPRARCLRSRLAGLGAHCSCSPPSRTDFSAGYYVPSLLYAGEEQADV